MFNKLEDARFEIRYEFKTYSYFSIFLMSLDKSFRDGRQEVMNFFSSQFWSHQCWLALLVSDEMLDCIGLQQT